MALIIRIDVDRPYGRQPAFRHVLSRLASDFVLPRMKAFGYLREVNTLLELLKRHNAKAYLFFRRCTSPPQALLQRAHKDGHRIGLHLENSRSYETFIAEKLFMERHFGQTVLHFSKHGSGRHKFGWHHYAPYEPEKYIAWGIRSGMEIFFGNLEDPTLSPVLENKGMAFFPSAFWLEPAWRDTATFPVDWLLVEAKLRDVVLLVHPENILAAPDLLADLEVLLRTLETRVLVSEKSAP